MNKELKQKDPIEGLLQEKLNKAFKESRKTPECYSMLDRGFVFFKDDGTGKINVCVLADSRTGEIIVELYESGRLPERLVRYVDEKNDGIKGGLALFLTETARIMGIDHFRVLAQDLGIPDAKNLNIYKFKDPRSLGQKIVDSM